MQGGNALAVPWLMFLAVAGAPEQYEKPAFTPIFTRRPFIVAWNAPTQDCEPRFKVQFDFSVFDVQASPNEGFVDQNLTIFYKERLGFYPYYDANNVAINGGVPQNSSLEKHLIRLTESIQKYIRSSSKEGLAVIDWEEWRPIWIRNWQPKDIYRNASRKLVLSRRPKLEEDQLKKQAQYEFESSACDFMRETLRYAKNFRPRQLWGYYLFPNCYNHDYRNNQDSYTGHCPDVEKTRNDHLAWLWKESTALFPSIYLEHELANTMNGRKFVRSRVKEGLRISQKHHDNYALPVFVYTRPTYSNGKDIFLKETDLISTIGESAALGAAGAIFWGDAENTRSKENCQLMKTYIEEPLGRYIINVTTAAELCSQTLCKGHGRCRRQESDASIFLHLNPNSFQIYRNESKHPKPLLGAKGKLSQADISFLQTHFQCHCYQGWHGKGCEKQLNPPGGGPSTSYTLGLQLLMTVFLLVCLH
ncbi:hyaluronidase-2 [Crotalus tigris]|uniref:hyaluronidase-2 n=1 Tax=Crotalus tigris TaxID=88082 RepID=UPI00192F7B2F|nr:hyaluronidase-2 [Crotalus tigris]XP_039214611.1 hyaluronidase-2 [Crotalus tigris]XP_039214612.1 hyaluronidase-2 [Crotalus tigris]XP_039214613.1 hyaluronidase-2 [Crotalus tigris]XP_039214614.1 hyaluronidase-2 [Crotalus tigris]XP_039214615.1 hyaluronidase-2 [Crotalus tigris]